MYTQMTTDAAFSSKLIKKAIDSSKVDPLFQKYNTLEDVALLEAVLKDDAFGNIAVVSSFGADSALLLAMVADVNASTPVIFLETGKHFPETIDYVQILSQTLGLENVHYRRPDLTDVKIEDTIGDLWESSVDACCDLRKVRPLDKALAGFDSWISGRKRFHGADRSDLNSVELSDGRLKINPLANWSAERIKIEFSARDLPQHPLVARGFLSIGCAPCTRAVMPGEDARAGRWADNDKTECGIHSTPWMGENI
jgi:phosphoadenosine phosphosulfate reductase